MPIAGHRFVSHQDPDWFFLGDRQQVHLAGENRLIERQDACSKRMSLSDEEDQADIELQKINRLS
jgi:hypothetical protein